MALTRGDRIGPYEIAGSLGAGGMGEVYRARDPRLDRDVAIKVLSSQLAKDPTAFARFEREAMSVARLSHPNILSIFEFVQTGDTAFVVTELVDGETLRARLEHGPLPARRAVGYALQIARGIAAAHARGIVHRDLKPENVMITRDDQVKILDFGLAKPVETSATDRSLVTGIATNAGTVLGTFGYMAPEQVRALNVDHRADIFSFGALLYEMLSGGRAFTGETAADTMTAILTKDPPDFDGVRLSISPSLDRIVRRCLEKNPDLRFQSANDLAFALDTLSGVSTSSASVADVAQRAPPVRAAWLPWVVAGIAVLAAAGSWIFTPAAPPAEGRWSSFTRITETAGEETGPTLSPDGGTVVYSMKVTNSWDIYSQRVGGRNATPIINDPQRDEGGAAFSPDGAQIAFHVSNALGGIFVAGATGESARRITDGGFDPAWSPDGKLIAYATEEVGDPYQRLGDSTMYVVDVGGGAPRKVLDGDAVQPSWSPSGERLVYWNNLGGQRDIYTVPAAGGMPVAVTKDAALDWSPVWSPDGKFIYFSSDRGAAMNLWRIAVDQSSGAVRGTPEAVTAGVQASAALPRFSKDGSRLPFRSRLASVNPIAIPFDPVALRAGTPALLDAQNNMRLPTSVSPDGKQLAFFSLGEPQEDLFIGPAEGGAMRRVTDDPARDRAPVFTPDGRSLVFYSNRDGQWTVWMVGVDGGGLRQVANPKGGAVYAFISPQGDRIAFNDSSGRAVFVAPLTSSAAPTELANTAVDNKFFTVSDWSNDGAKLAGFVSSASGRPAGVAVYDLAARATTILSDDETFGVKWLSDSRRVLYFDKRGSELVVLDTVTRQRTPIEVRLPGPATTDVFAISRDNRTIYYGAARAIADIWIVERK